MTETHKPQPTLAQVATWLATQHTGEIVDLAPLAGGFWSSAFAYRVGADAFVLRLSEMAEGFAIDAAAMRFTSPALPIPAVVACGRALGLHFAISRRHYGQFIETMPVAAAPAVGGALAALLAALRAAPAQADEGVIWYEAVGANAMTWRDCLRGGLVDNPAARVSGWRAQLAANARLDTLFNRCEARIEQLLPVCPERRDLIHGDLLHQNVLMAADGRHVTGIFSWKCSVRGDFLFDVAWCTFWSYLYPVIAAAALWRHTCLATDLQAADLVDASARHHCYELCIAASHLGWFAWIGDQPGLLAVADAAERVLERGPLPVHRAAEQAGH